MEARGVYTLGPECIDPLLARKMALTWAHKAQHGLTMPQESSQCSPRMAPGSRTEGLETHFSTKIEV